MLAQAISSTMAVTPRSSRVGVVASLAISLCPCAPSLTTIGFVLKRASVGSLMFFWEGNRPR